jgi:RND superfamily putative drug exporter
MFAGLGRFIVRARWGVVVAAVALVIFGATWGAGVFADLAAGGFLDTGTPSGQARAHIESVFGAQDPDVLVVYTDPAATVDDPAFAAAVTGALAAAKSRPEVSSVVDFFDTPLPALVSRDRHATYAIVKLRSGDDGRKLTDYRAVKAAFAAPGLTVQYGGLRSFYDDVNSRTKSDVERAEALSMPILLLLLVIIFRSVVAAFMPLLVGGLAILGAFVVVRLLTYATTVSTFAINIITLIGLGLAIDYSLFMVSRFREELDAGRTPREAILRTMVTAGRTVAVSGVTVTLALAGLLLFPQVFLRSMSYGAMSAVVVAMIVSLTVLPAVLVLLGPRINAWRIPFPRRRVATGPGARGAHGAWARLAHSVMRRPWLYLVGVLAVLALLAAPVRHITFGGLDTRALPADAPSRVVTDVIARDFPPTDGAPIQVIVSGGEAGGVAATIKALPGVTGVTPAAAKGSDTLLTVDYDGLVTGPGARGVVTAIRGLTPPAGLAIGVTGSTADLIDQLDGLGRHLPWMILFVVLVTSVLLFLAFGSVVLPIKAVLMNAVSLGAAFGAVVWVFQDGHLSGLLGFTPTGVIEPTNPILMIAVLFGLATDYEVFLLSRVREEWDHQVALGTPPDEANTASVATGLQRTGQIITSAALLLVIVVIGFASGDIAFVKLIGVGMIVAIIVDATLVRALLVPATMRLLGHWNWWAPGPLGRVYRRYGIRESDPAVRPEPAEPVEPDEPVEIAAPMTVPAPADGRAGVGTSAV